MDLTIVIPAYNEELRVGQSLERIFAFVDSHHHTVEVIVVDDGSSDGTAAVVQALRDSRLRLLRNERNRGKGYSVKRGMLEATSDLVLFSDADLSTPIEEVEALAEQMLASGADGAIGSRAVPGSRVEVSQALYRVAMGKIFNAFVRLLTLPGYADTQCGFKLFRRDAAQAIFSRQTCHGFAFDVEILFIARRLGLTILELPVRWLNSPETKVSAVDDSIKMFGSLLKIRWNALRGCYR